MYIALMPMVAQILIKTEISQIIGGILKFTKCVKTIDLCALSS